MNIQAMRILGRRIAEPTSASYIIFMHPQAEVDFATMRAKAEWKSKYRFYRMIKPREMSAREIVELVKPPVADL